MNTELVAVVIERLALDGPLKGLTCKDRFAVSPSTKLRPVGSEYKAIGGTRFRVLSVEVAQ